MQCRPAPFRAIARSQLDAYLLEDHQNGLRRGLPFLGNPRLPEIAFGKLPES